MSPLQPPTLVTVKMKLVEPTKLFGGSDTVEGHADRKKLGLPV
jgi:hypothetical protein